MLVECAYGEGGTGRDSQQQQARERTREARRERYDRVQAMRAAVRDVTRHSELQSPTDRLKLKVAAMVVGRTSMLGRRGPAEGSVLQPKDDLMHPLDGAQPPPGLGSSLGRRERRKSGS